jgi:hypothetical protein
MRRSMAELAASLQGGAIQESALEPPLANRQHSPATPVAKDASITTDTSPDYANVLVSASSSPVLFSEPAGQPREQEIERGTSRREATGAAQDYREKVFKLMTAQARANLQYTNKLTGLTTPFEFIELTTNHARKQFELIMLQTVALGEFFAIIGNGQH